MFYFLQEGNWVSASLTPNDRGFLYGDGVFTTLRVEQGKPLALRLHLERLKRHCESIRIIPPDIPPKQVYSIIQFNNATQGIWRLKIIITGGTINCKTMKQRSAGNIFFQIEPYEHTAKLHKLVIYPTKWNSPLAKVKSLAYLERLCIFDYAQIHQADEALVLSPEGWMLETAFSALFWKIDNNLCYPNESLPRLDSISLEVIKHAAHSLKMQCIPCKTAPKDLPSHAQLFLCNSLTGPQPIASIADRLFPRDLSFEQRITSAYSFIPSDLSG